MPTPEIYAKQLNEAGVTPDMPPEEVARRLNAAGVKPDRKVASGSGVDFFTRAKASFASTPEGQKNIISKNLPEGSEVVTLKDGSLGVRDKAGSVRAVDPQEGGLFGTGLEFGDIADFAGDVPEIALGSGGAIAGAVGGLGAGSIPAAAAGGAAGSAAGNLIKQLGAKVLGADEDLSLRDTAIAAGTGAIGEGVGAPLIKAGTKVASNTFLKPLGALFKNKANKAGVQATRRVAEELGIDASKLPPSALTESKLVQASEQFLRESPTTTDLIEDRIDKPFRDEVGGALGRIRESIGGLSDDTAESFPLRSGIDQGEFGKTLINTVEEHKEATKGAIDKAFGEFEKLVPQGLPATVNNTKALVNEHLKRLEKFPSLNKGSMANLGALSEALDNVKSVGDLKQLKELVGDLAFDRETFGDLGNTIFANIMKDFDDNFAKNAIQFRAVGAASSSEAATEAYRRARDLARRQFELDQSSAVQKVFGKGRKIDVEKIDNAAQKVFGSKSKEAITAFKQRIGAEASPEGTPATEQGKVVWEQMRQLYLDRILGESASEPGELALSGKRFFSKLFGRDGLGDENVELIFGPEATGKLKAFSQLLLDGNVSQRFFANFSNTAKRAEVEKLFTLNPFKMMENVLGGLAKRVGAKTLSTDAGRRFLTEGVVPSGEKFFRRIGQSRIARPIQQAGVRIAGVPSVIEPLFPKEQ